MLGGKIHAPVLKDIQNIKIGGYEHYILDNGIPVYEVAGGGQDVLKVELIVPGGKWQEQKRCVANFTSKMLKEGTHTHSSEDIADIIDNFGASIKVSFSADICSITLFCLNKYLDRLLQLMTELLTEASFPNEELELKRKIVKQKYLVSKERIEYIAQKVLLREIFGHEHPYGYFESEEDLDHIHREDLRKFYDHYFTSRNARLFVSGKPTVNSRKLINKYLGQEFNQSSNGKDIAHSPKPGAQYVIYQEIDDVSQAAIRIGKPMIKKGHKDYNKLRILNTILGGYFGSRLMSNIREDKGYTYGIYSTIHSYQNEGIFYVGSEVGSEVATDAVREIYREIERLRNEPVPQEELELVKNYLRGTILSSIDGPFNTASVLKGLVLFDLPEEHFYDLLNTINSVTSHELQEMAHKYLQTSDLYEVIAGLKE